MARYQLLFAAAQPASDEAIQLHVFEVAFDAEADLIGAPADQADAFVAEVIEASLEAKGKPWLAEHVVPETIHVCEGENPCLEAQILSADLRGVMPSGFVQANQRNEA